MTKEEEKIKQEEENVRFYEACIAVLFVTNTLQSDVTNAIRWCKSGKPEKASI